MSLFKAVEKSTAVNTCEGNNTLTSFCTRNGKRKLECKFVYADERECNTEMREDFITTVEERAQLNDAPVATRRRAAPRRVVSLAGTGMTT